MRPPPFSYADPSTVEEALGLLAEHGDDAGILAGGQSFVPLLNFRLARPDVIVDINRIADLAYIEQQNGVLRIGALTRHRAVEQSALAREACPLLSEAIGHVGHAQIRNRGTVGGSLAHADPAAELPAVVTALGGQLRLRNASGERTLDPGDFFVSSLTTAIEPDEMLVAVELPAWPAGTATCFAEFSRRQGDFALAGAGAVLAFGDDGRVERAGLALMGVGDRPFDGVAIASELLCGEAPNEAVVRAVAERVASSVEPASDLHAPADYRRHLAGVLTRRALLGAMERRAAAREAK
ncbi:MAG: xanthine dehydrogenase family protein subunit M [Gammaproteobacteria bacterium]|nr:xanthine dehydrogenase family protein subunit M [Gammaproteobacteria bacterium]